MRPRGCVFVPQVLTNSSWAACVFAVPLPVQGTTPAQGRLVCQLPIRQLLGVSHVKGHTHPQKLLDLMKLPNSFGSQGHVLSTYRTNSCIESGKSRVTANSNGVRPIRCQQHQQSNVLNPNRPADSSRPGRARRSGMSSWHRGRRVVIAGEIDAGVFAEFVEAVIGLDDADGARLGSHHD
jgi:hypothetical protein